jgi:hypothetical protein
MTYCSRQTAMRAVDFRDGIDQNEAADRAIETASTNIDANLHRVFYPTDATRYFDWPNQGGSGGGQYAYPWRLWLDQYDCVVLTAMTSGGTAIPLDQVFAEPVNSGPPYTYLELDRSSTAAFGSGSTPQHSIALTGTFGYGADADPAGALAAGAGDTDTTITVTDGSKTGVGDLLVLGYGRGSAPYPAAAGYAGAIAPYTGERVLVTGVAAADTGLAQDTGATAASDSDQALTWTGSGSLNVGEVLVLDSEQMLVEQITGSVATVRRAWNGTTLATHSAATIYAERLLSVTRAMYGTSAATYSSAAAVYRHRVPALVRDLCVAEAVNQVLQEGSGYARTIGSGADAHPAPGADLASKWDECMTAHGRKARVRAV